MLGWAMRIKARFDEDKIWILKTNGSQICDKDISYTYIGQSQDMKRSVDKLLRTKIGKPAPRRDNCFIKNAVAASDPSDEHSFTKWGTEPRVQTIEIFFVSAD